MLLRYLLCSVHEFIYSFLTLLPLKHNNCSFSRLVLRQLYYKLVIPHSSPFYKTWRTIVFGSSLLFFVVHTAIASFNVSFQGLGYGASGGIIVVYAALYLYDLILVLDILIDVRTAIENHEKGTSFVSATILVIHCTFTLIASACKISA